MKIFWSTVQIRGQKGRILPCFAFKLKNRESLYLLRLNLLHKMAAGTKQLTSNTRIETPLFESGYFKQKMC